MIVESANMRNRQWLDNVNVLCLSSVHFIYDIDMDVYLPGASRYRYACVIYELDGIIGFQFNIRNMSAFAWLILTVVRNNSAPRLSAFKAFLWGSAGIDADDGSTIYGGKL